MIKYYRFYVALIFTGLLMAYTPMSQADMGQQKGYVYNHVSNADAPLQPAS